MATLSYVLMGPFLLLFTLHILPFYSQANRVAVLGLILIALAICPLFGHQLIMNLAWLRTARLWPT